MRKFKFTADIGITIALGILGVAQFILNNRKEAKALDELKEELKDEILKDLTD